MKKLGLFLLLFVALSNVSCKKRKIEKNIEGVWILSQFYLDGTNQVTANTSHSIEFKNVDDGKGTMVLYTSDNQGSYTTFGNFELTDKHEKIKATLIDGTYHHYLNGTITVTENTVEINGTSSDNNGSPTTAMIIKGSN